MAAPAAPRRGTRVTIIADDCGYSTPRDDGILEAFTAGLLSGGSVMVNGMTAERMVVRAVAAGMLVGLHLNLTEGVPISPPETIPSLVTVDAKQGKRVFWGKEAFHARAEDGSLDSTDVQTEARAQLLALTRMLEAARGRTAHASGNLAKGSLVTDRGARRGAGAPSLEFRPPIAHVDGHQHCHVHPRIASALGPLFAEHGLPRIRLPLLSQAEDRSAALAPGGAHFAKRGFIERISSLAAHSRAIYAASGLLAPIAFVGFACMGREMRHSSCVAALVLDAHQQAVEGLAALGATGRDIRGISTDAPLSRVGLNEVELMTHPGKATTAASVHAAAISTLGGGSSPGLGIESLAGCGCGPDQFSASPDRLEEAAGLARVVSELHALGASSPGAGQARNMRTLAAALLALAASARALTVSQCTSVGTATTVTYDATKTCYKGTFASGGTLDISVDVPSSMDGKDIGLIMWNAAQSPTFAANVVYQDTTGTTAAVNVRRGRQSATVATQIPFFYEQAVGDVRMGEHHFVVSAGAGDWAFVVDQGIEMPTTTIGSVTGAMYRVLPTSSTPSATVSVSGGFIDEHIIVKEAKVDVTPSSNSPAAAVASTTFASAASASESTASGTTTAVFQRVARPTTLAVDIEVTLNDVASMYYNWAVAGPFMTGTVAMPAAGVTAYPKIKAGVESSLSITAAARAFADNDVVELEVDLMWWNLTVNAPTTATVGASPYKTGAPTVYISWNPSDDAFTDGTSMSIKSPSPLIGASLTFENPGVRISNPASLTLANTVQISPVSFDITPHFFLRVVRNNDQPATGALDVKLTYTTTAVSGSCKTYADCFAPAESHPGIRSLLSANDDATRLRQCLLVPSEESAYRPTAQCLECTADVHCGAGEYCHSDAGVCTDSNGHAFVCDPSSNSLFGLCVAKDPTGEILGSGCRADTAAVFSTSTSFYSASVIPLVANVGTNEEGTSQSNGYGFCGGAVYYNASFAQPSSSGVSATGVARRVLWEGKCVDGVCRECDEGTASSNGNMQCINGRIIRTVTVDGTARTATQSVLAATMLAATLMIVLAIIIGLVDCVCRHRWRAADVKQRKLMHKQRNAHKDAENALFSATSAGAQAARA